MFVLKNGKVDIEPKALFIPEFRAIYERDKSKTKSRAMQELAYVYFTSDYKTEYNIYNLEKNVMVATEVMGDPTYEPDDVVASAMRRYESMQETFSMQFLKNIRATIISLNKFYEDLRYKSKQTNVTDYDPSLVTKAMKDVEIVLEKIEKWEKKVKGEEDLMQIRGGGRLGLFEDPEKATWMKSRK